MRNYLLEAVSGDRVRGGANEKPDVEGEVVPGVAGPQSRAALLEVGVRSLPWLLVLGAATAALSQTGTPAIDIARYLAYWCLGVTLPGLLVVRATVGSAGNWPEDVALGAVTGLGLEVLCFALWSVLGLQQQLWLWPLLVGLAFVAVPGLRRHWRLRSPRPLPRLWSWGVASAIVICIATVRRNTFASLLPPAGGVYYQDLPWHLAIVHELTRSFPPQISQVAGEVLRYHWFSHAHMASAHLVSGVPEATVLLRLWIIPVLAVTALLGARLAVELSGKWWSGPVAAWALVVLGGTDLLPVAGEVGILFPGSPSHAYVLPVFLGVVILIVRALRGVRLGAGWAVLALLLVLAAGAKPTAMPLVLAGTGLAGLALLVQRRRQWLAALGVVAMVAVILPISLLAVAGGGSGSTISLFDFVEWIPLYHQLTGAGYHRAIGPLLPEGVNDLSARSVTILALLFLIPLVANLGRLVPFAWLGSRRMRQDPAAWFMAGVVLAGWVVYLVLSHWAYSQAYFLRLASPIALVFGAWALAAAVPPASRSGRGVGTVLAGGSVIGFAVVALGRALTPALPAASAMSVSQESLTVVVASFVAPLAVLGAATVLGSLGWVVARQKVPGLRGWGSSLALAALVLGGPAYNAFKISTPALVAFVADKPVPSGSRYRLSPGAGAAMAWVEQNTPDKAVVATNRQCVAGKQRPRCLALTFRVSGFGGRRTVLEGWGYTSAAGKYSGSPSPFPERLAINDAAFTDPSAATIERLRKDYGASWLVADTSAGPVSSELAQFAVARFSSGEVTVYQLR